MSSIKATSSAERAAVHQLVTTETTSMVKTVLERLDSSWDDFALISAIRVAGVALNSGKKYRMIVKIGFEETNG